jgi:hypothetical protein
MCFIQTHGREVRFLIGQKGEKGGGAIFSLGLQPGIIGPRRLAIRTFQIANYSRPLNLGVDNRCSLDIVIFKRVFGGVVFADTNFRLLKTFKKGKNWVLTIGMILPCSVEVSLALLVIS